MKALILMTLLTLSACGKKASDDGRPKLPTGLDAPHTALSQSESFVQAVQDNRTSAVVTLLRAGANPDTLMPDGSTPLTYSILRSNEETMQALLRAGANANKRDKNGEIPLLLALKNRSDSMARSLIAHGADINVRDAQNRTPLMIAITLSNAELANWMIQRGADTSLRDSRERDALTLARENNMPGLVAILDRSGAGEVIDDDVAHWQSTIESRNPSVIRDALRQNPRLVHTVLTPGALTQTIDHVVQPEISLEIVSVLLEAGLSANGTPQDTHFPLNNAAEKGLDGHVRLLLEKGAQVHVVDGAGQSALIYAVLNQHVRVVRALISKNAPKRYTARVGNLETQRFDACDMAREIKNSAEDRDERKISEDVIKALRCGWRGLFSG